MHNNQSNIFNAEQALYSLFKHYPADFIVNSLLPLLPPIETGGINENTPMREVFYAELDYLIQKSLNTYQSHVHIDDEDINTVVSLLIKIIPVGYIFYIKQELGKSLVIVIDQYNYKPIDEIKNLVSVTLLAYPTINCLIYTYGSMINLLNDGHFFYSSLCVPTNCIYQANAVLSLPIPSQFKICLKQTKFRFTKELNKAEHFLLGAHQFFMLNQNGMAAFMLQQACEFSYNSLIAAFMGKHIKTHLLTVLRKNCLVLAPNVNGIFYAQTKKEMNLLATLEECYVKARYHTDFDMEASSIIILLKGTESLIKGVKLIFEQKLAMNYEYLSSL